MTTYDILIKIYKSLNEIENINLYKEDYGREERYIVQNSEFEEIKKHFDKIYDFYVFSEIKLIDIKNKPYQIFD